MKKDGRKEERMYKRRAQKATRKQATGSAIHIHSKSPQGERRENGEKLTNEATQENAFVGETGACDLEEHRERPTPWWN